MVVRQVFFTQYEWPYPAKSVFILFMLISWCGQFFIKLKCGKKKYRLLLPLITGVDFICAILSFFVISPPPGVLLGEIDVALAIALPGLAVITGVIIGEMTAGLVK